MSAAFYGDSAMVSKELNEQNLPEDQAKYEDRLNEESFDIRETYAAQETALAKVWDDPALDVYNDVPVDSSPLSSPPRSA
jgi:hypothetical protein